MGVVSHRAGTGREASSVLNATRIHIAVVDLGLPLDTPCQTDPGEEAGARLLELLARQAEPTPTVVVKRCKSHRDDLREMNAALRLGAFAVVDRPRQASDLNLMLEVLRRCLARHYRGMWPG
jgi:DNA-binding NarL/FixJ family response regulator